MSISDFISEIYDNNNEDDNYGGIPVSSIDEYMKICIYISRKANSQIWYRGQGCNYSLVPSLYRIRTPVFDAIGNPVGKDFCSNKGGVQYKYLDFESMLNSFKREAVHYLKRIPIDDFEWMFIMQHHGVPTRLLDWTTDPLTALFFATEPTKNRWSMYQGSSEVWLMDPLSVNIKSHDVDQIVHLSQNKWNSYIVGEEEFPICVYSSHVDDRIVAQNGTFTLHGSLLNPINYYSHISREFIKIHVPSDVVPKLHDDLHRIGYTRTRLFPGVDAVASAVHTAEMKRYSMWKDQQPTQDELLFERDVPTD